ncbi:NAD-dependent succinate-semialdehyde dehydrogenase [Nesterenkonia muleiensis]|uniref:NAD-dependent succinate-semialdehyde dehydrogenase n=1 Tax=Nesterenkonia muleiensis TaxID=2282648 RepID=UPI000E741B32|nr:NAD-dependent succinate-semialdehyde dehydrogenase [Nesterenkonia muleiensis]
MTTFASSRSKASVDIRGHQVPTGLLINGQWVDERETFPVINPSTGETICEVSSAAESRAREALNAADAAQTDWGVMNHRMRARLLHGALALIKEREEQFIAVMTAESGKPIAESAAEFALSSGFFEWTAEQAAHVHGNFGPGSNPGYRVITTHQPVGPSLLLTPWNFPMLMGARKISAALAAGCTTIIKSAQQTPLTLALLVETLQEAGIPSGVVNLLHTTRSSEVSSPLLSDHRLRKISFTGSTTVGSHLIGLAAKNIVNTSMELGGNAAFIVLDDADVDLAVRQGIDCKFRNAGQACVAANKFILHKDIAEEFTEKFVAATRELVVGDGSDPAANMGPVITEDQRQRVHALVRSALSDGADLLTGGRPLDRDGFYYEPTVLRGVPTNSPLACDEIFGPVAVLHTVSSVAEATKFANETEYGLANYVFTRDISRAIRIGEELESGMVGVNRGVMADPMAPFGGTGASGIGREGGEHGIHEFLEPHYIALTVDEGANQ